ncbi:hypothetical protein [Roseateles albus]|uniref:Sel1 repeat family protein n=1 Tax=Roseateles albus TaxID=2987525 RepID=A0ABT5KFE1_9BURK|nr:hypothetical protein [Roseateles albus]MDC8772644.1 hypothetical protein [Roseateles albus]
MGAIALAALLVGAYSYWPAAQDRQPAIATTSTIAPVALPSAAASSPIALPLALAASTVPKKDLVKAPSQPNPIGSEGYGPHIERAHQGVDPKAAWQAVEWLFKCASHAGVEENWQATLDSGLLPKESAAMMTELLAKHRADAGRCQTVIAAHQALLPDLALKAMRGNIPGAAAAYAGGRNLDQLDPTLQTELQSAIRADAQAGDMQTLFSSFSSDEKWGLGYTERLGYMAAWIALQPPGHGQAVIEGQVQSGRFKMKPPSATQLAEAMLLAQKIYETASKARKPSGA